MKSVIYKNPVISAFIINIITLVMLVYSIRNREYGPVGFLILIGVVNRRIIDNGDNVNKKQRNIIFTSFFILIIIFVTYAIYRYKVINTQIINGL
jgi:hypothetical protein